MPQTGQTTPSGGREWSLNTQGGVAKPVNLAEDCTINHVGIWCREQNVANSNDLMAAVYTAAGGFVAQSQVLAAAINSTATHALYQIPFDDEFVAAGNYVIIVMAGPASTGNVIAQGQNDSDGTVSYVVDTEADIYPVSPETDFPADISAFLRSDAARQWDVYIDWTAAEAGGVEITSIDDVTLTHGQTGVTITGTGFSASGNEVIISPTDDIDDPDAVSQTITSENATTIDFTADLDSFAFGTLYVFVRNADDESNADGEPASRIVASATLNFTGDDAFFDENGDPVEMTGTLYVWRAPRPPTSVGTPDQIITAFATDSNGERSQSINLGSLDDGDTVYGMLFGADGTDLYWAGEVLPDYA